MAVRNEPLAVATERSTYGRDVFDAVATVALAVAVALWLRTRPEPVHLPAFWIFVPLIGSGLIRSPRLQRVWRVISVGLLTGAMVSMPWIR